MKGRSILPVITCEHAGNCVPKTYRKLFSDKKVLLASHRGFDSGAIALAKSLARGLEAPLFYSYFTRLLVDVNRSPANPDRFSKITRRLSTKQKEEIISRYYDPYRNAVFSYITGTIRNGSTVLHVSVHSFTPRRQGKTRNADIGILYDPKKMREKNFAHELKRRILLYEPNLKVRRNYPYLGISDGFTSYIRSRFSDNAYIGIEIEINQKHVADKQDTWQTVLDLIVQSVSHAINKSLYLS